MIFLKHFVLATFSLLLAGCADYGGVPIHDAALPEFENSQQAGLFDRVCRPLANSKVTLLLQQLEDQNLQLSAAWSRLQRARAVAQQRGAQSLPEFNLNLEATRSKVPLPEQFQQLFPQQPSQQNRGYIFNEWQSSLAASYEMDVWNRLGSLAEAAAIEAQAQYSDVRAINVSLNAQLLESWFELAYLRQQRQLLQRHLEISRQLLEVLKLRFVTGQASVLDSLQQEQQLKSLLGRLAENVARRQQARNQVLLLIGAEPQRDQERPFAARLPELAELDSQMVFSAALLARRPDLRRAFYQLHAADAELAAALAQRLPSVRLSASLFDQSSEASDLGNNVFWRVATAITQPLFSGGRISAQIAVAQATVRETLAAYRQSLLNAMQELASAWSSERQAAAQGGYLTAQEALADEAYTVLREQYMQGVAEFTRVLEALTLLINVQQERLLNRRQRVSYRVQFCRALGDDWLLKKGAMEASMENMP